MKRAYYLIVLLATVCLFLYSGTAQAEITDDIVAPPQEPGIISGTGIHFEVTDSRYQNLNLDSTETVKVRLESVPETITAFVESADVSAISTEITISGLSPDTTYHMYTDDLHNHEIFTTDAEGKYAFNLYLLESHVVTIQPRPSTLFLSLSGWSNPAVGTWDAATKTGRLTQNVTETIQIDGNGITLDGQGYSVTGSNSGYGVYIPTRSSTTVKNLNISSFSYGIFVQNSHSTTIQYCNTGSNSNYGIYSSSSNSCQYLNNNASGNYQGIRIMGGVVNISGNTCSSNSYYGIYVDYGNSTTVTNNSCTYNGQYGIYTANYFYGSVTYNTASYNTYGGIYVGGGTSTTIQIKNNIANYNSGTSTGYGINLRVLAAPSVPGVNMQNNTMSGNRYNFNLEAGSASSITDAQFNQSIDTTNTVDGKPIRYYRNQTGLMIDSSLSTGCLFLINCSDSIVKDMSLTKNGTGLYLWKPTNITVQNVTASDNYNAGIYALRGSNLVLDGCTCRNNYIYGAYLYLCPNTTCSSNTISLSKQYGLYLQECSDSTLTGNSVSSNTYYGLLLQKSTGCTISENNASFNGSGYNQTGGHGIGLTGNCSNNSITENKAWNNCGSGIALFSGSNNNTVSGNESYSNSGGNGNSNSNGIYIQTCNDNLIFDNIFNNNYRGVAVMGQYSTSPAVNNLVYRNIIRQNTFGAITANYASNTKFYNNNFLFNATQAYASKLSGVDDQNVFNLPAPTGGNYWSNKTAPDTNHDGFIDTPYAFENQHQDNLPLARPTDVIAPTTTAEPAGDAGEGGWYRSDITITLTATDDAGGTGVAKTEYSYDGNTWTTYIGPITFDTEGTGKLYYRSIDRIGNIEQSSSQDTTVFNDDFNGFSSFNWPDASFLSSFSGRPQLLIPTSIDGRTVLDMKSTETPSYKRRGISTSAAIDFATDSVIETAFKPKQDSYSVNNILEFWLYNPSNNKYAMMKVYVDNYGYTPLINAEFSGQSYQTSGYNLWTWNEWLYFRIESTANNTSMSILDAGRNARWTAIFNGSLASIVPSGKIAFSQYLINPYSATYNLHAYVDSVKVVNTIRTYKSVDLKIDKTKPVSQIDLDGTIGAGDWYVSDVNMTLSAADNNDVDKIQYALNGGDWVDYDDTVTISDGPYVDISYRAVDIAGNIEDVRTESIKIDKNPPETVCALTGTGGNNGWFVSDVQAVLTATDNEGGMAGGVTKYSFDGDSWSDYNGAIDITDEGETTLYYYSIDAAGNTEEAQHRMIRIDKSSQPTAVTVTGTLGDNGWYISDCLIALDAVDDISGVDKVEYKIDDGALKAYGDPFTISEGIKTITYHGIDKAGNTEVEKSREIKIDTTPPLITGAATAEPNAFGWYNNDVTIAYSAADDGSGIASVSPDAIVVDEGAGQSATGTATDNAGNSATATVSGINIDKTAPVITGSKPPANDYGWYNSDITVDFEAGDELSGLDSVTPDTLMDTEGVGQTVTGTATDKAGNSAQCTVEDINIDKTAPSISGSRLPLANEYGWNNSDVTVSFTADDSLSGIVEDPEPTTLTAEGAGQSVAASVTDKAGNSAECTVGGINIDKTAPTISGTATTEPNAFGWYNDDVSVHFDCADGLSGLVEDVDDVTISTEGSDQSATATAADKAGNSASATVSGINIDKTAPTIAGNKPPANEHGWYNSDIMVDFEAIDDLSGIDTVTPDTLVDAEDADQSVCGTATDKAGNSAECTVADINIDKTVPTISGAATTEPNDAGWYNSDVTIHFTADDAISGLDMVTPDALLSTEGADQSATGTAIDLAGNTASTTVIGINIDNTGPQTEISLTGTEGANGWYISTVNITLTAADALSDLKLIEYSINDGEWQTYADPIELADGVYEFSYRSQDFAGNIEPETTRTVKIDTVAPQISGAPTTTANANGWYNSDVTVHFEATDETSDISVLTPDVLLTGEGKDQIATGTAIDYAGNTASTTVVGINIDKTAPVIFCYPQDGDQFIVNQLVLAFWWPGDSLSGIDSASGSICRLSLLDTFAPGEHTINISAMDKAGNVTDMIIHYYIRYWYSGILKPINEDGSSVFKKGSTIPIKFQLKNAFGNSLPGADCYLMIAKVSNNIIGTWEEPISTCAADDDNEFRYSGCGQYIFNLSTKSLTTGTYQLWIMLDDGSSKYAQFSLR